MKRPLLPVITILCGLSSLFSSPAHAERHPWKDAAQAAAVTDDSPTSPIQLTTLLPTNGTDFLALDPNGHPVSFTRTGTVTPLPDGSNLPSFSAMTRNGNTFWGITSTTPTTLIQFSATGKTLTTLPLKGDIKPDSNFTALQIHDTSAFLTDEKNPALVLSSLKDGQTRRFLSFDPSLMGRTPLKTNGQTQIGPDNHPITGGNVRFLLLDSKGQWLFYMPACGPLYRIDSALLADPAFTPVEQLDGIVEWRGTPSLGGITLRPDNTFFMTDIEHAALLQFGADRVPLIILHDPRLINASAIATQNKEVFVLTREEGKPHILHIALP